MYHKGITPIIIAIIIAGIFILGGGVYVVQKGYFNKVSAPMPSVALITTTPMPTSTLIVLPTTTLTLASATSVSTTINHYQCLAGDESVNMETISEDKNNYSFTNKFSIINNQSKNEIANFTVSDINVGMRNLPYLGKCGIYVKRVVNGSGGLWQYLYDGSGKKIADAGDGGVVLDFLVNPFENFVGILKGYGGPLVVKDLKTMQDVFSVSGEEICDKYKLCGSMEIIEWRGKILRVGYHVDCAPNTGGCSYDDSGFFEIDAEKKILQAFPPGTPLSSIGHRVCLADDEIINYGEDSSRWAGGSAVITLFKKDTNQAVSSLTVDNFAPHSFVRDRKCGFYVMRQFLNNDNIKGNIYLPGESIEIWQYTYDGNAKRMFVLSEIDQDGNRHDYFSSRTFDVDSTETYIALAAPNSGDFAIYLFIRNLKTDEEVFRLDLLGLQKKYGENSLMQGQLSWNDYTNELVTSLDGPFAPGEGGDGEYIDIRIKKGTWEVVTY